jgi:hypothetical protein
MADKPAHAPPKDTVPTFRPARTPVILVAGGPDELLDATRRAAEIESPSIVVEACPAVAAATAASSVRPFALVLSQDIYAFDPAEFAALARDVQAELVVVKVSRSNAGFLEQALRPSLRNAFRRFRAEQQSGPVRR